MDNPVRVPVRSRVTTVRKSRRIHPGWPFSTHRLRGASKVWSPVRRLSWQTGGIPSTDDHHIEVRGRWAANLNHRDNFTIDHRFVRHPQ